MKSIPQEVEILTNDLIWAKHYFNQFMNLYSNKKSRIDLLNDTAPLLFKNLHDLLWHEMIISISKLTDPYKTKKFNNENLTINYLPILATNNSWSFKQDLETSIEEANEKAKPIRTMRNKKIAHRDLPTALGLVEVDNLAISQIEEAFKSIGKVINLIYLHLEDTEKNWDLRSATDSKMLILHLKNAMIYREMLDEEKDWQKKIEREKRSRYLDA